MRKNQKFNPNQLDLFGSIPSASSSTLTTSKSKRNKEVKKESTNYLPAPEPAATKIQHTGPLKIQYIPKSNITVNGSYADYQVQVKVQHSKQHPSRLCESMAMASISIPEPDYTPKVLDSVINSGLLSEAQLENIVLAGHAHSRFLPETNYRQGFMIGDGTGVGKGNMVAGIIMDNFLQGRTKALWISKNDNAHSDSLKYWTAVGGSSSDFIDHAKIKKTHPIHHSKGVLMTKYGLLKTGYSKNDQDDEDLPTIVTGRLKQILDWLGTDFDGIIAFDESHVMANAMDEKSSRGTKKASMVSEVGITLQQLLPKARIIYASATGATEVQNLIYAERLGLYGPGTPFANSHTFINEINKSGVTAMELIARDLKSLGLYSARSLSYDGVEYGSVIHKITDPQKELYNELATAWQIVLRDITEAIKLNQSSKQAKAAALSSFWSTHQRFFNLLILTIQFPTVAEDIQKHLDAGECIVIQLTNTNEAQTRRAIADAKGSSPDGNFNVNDLDISPKSMLIEYITNSFPVVQFESYEDDHGSIKQRPCYDKEGNLILNYESVQMRDKLIEKINNELHIPKGPLDTFIDYFGEDNIAEVTGRSMRLVEVKDTMTGEVTIKEQRRSQSHVKKEIQDFKDDKRRILIFSDAGSTGASFHSEKGLINTRRRIHYAYQPGWRADNAVQGFGRTHRSNAENAPMFKLCSTDISAQKRFLSSIARRLEQLGALTKGQRDTGGQGILDNNYNLEGYYAQNALCSLYHDIVHTSTPISMDDLENMMGLQLMIDVDGTKELNKKLLFDIKKFLNRILSLEIDVMNKVFNAFETKMKGLIKQAKSEGTFDTGIHYVQAEHTEVIEELPIYEEPRTKAKTYLSTLKLQVKAHKTTWSSIQNLLRWEQESFLGFFQQLHSNKVYACFKSHDRRTESGELYTYYERIGISGKSIVLKTDFEESHVNVSFSHAQQLWETEFLTVNDTKEEFHTIVKGLLLPIWNKIPGETQVNRYIDDTGTTHLGRFIQAKYLPIVRRTFELKNSMSIREVLNRLNHGYIVELDNGFKLRATKIQGIPSIEITEVPRTYYNQLQDMGFFLRIQNKIMDLKSAHIPKNMAAEKLPELMTRMSSQIQNVYEK